MKHTLKWAGVITILAFLVVSCGGNNGGPPGVDRTGLQAAIAEAQARLADTDVSTNGADVHDNRYWTNNAVRTTFQAAIASAQSVNANGAATQGEVTAAATAMSAAITAFTATTVRTLGSLPLDQVSRAGLNAAINDAIALRDGTEIAPNGNNLMSTVFWATQTAHTTFSGHITTAEGVRDDTASTQEQVDSARNALIAAHNTFYNARNPGALAPFGGFLGMPARLSGQVYYLDWTPAGLPSFTVSSVDATVTAWGSTVGTITNGILDVTLGTPTSPLSSIGTFWLIQDLENVFNNVTVSNDAVQAATLNLSTSNPGGGLGREFASGTDANFSDQLVWFIYVSAGVTISGTGRVNTFTDDGFTETITTTTFSLPLRQGWNAVHEIRIGSFTETSGAMNISLHHRNPGHPVRWVLDGGGGGGAPPAPPPGGYGSIEPAVQELPSQASRWLRARR
ncbi:MAG: hypothetical protein FWC64_13400 [Treponema sp.]|nr:hypothetical protein [Treponema sp.]